jgi:hypothetical protein
VAILKLFKERVEARPAAGTFEPAARSALRTLGLAATAARGEVFDAASSVRLALKLGVRKTFEGDAAWLFGAASREESDVRDAVGRLSEPAQRARERLFWFHGAATHAHASTVAELTRVVKALLADGSAAALHDAALLALCGLVRLDPALRDVGAWARAFELWRRVFECEEFWSLLVAADLKGDYEQPVTFGEVAELRLAAPRVVAEHVAVRARETARRGNLREAAHALTLLRGAGLPGSLLQEYENEVVGPAEDELVEKLDVAFAWVGLGGPTAPPATRRNYWNQAWRRFDALRPRLAEFAELAGADSYAARRVFEHAASKLFRLAVSFEEVGRTPEALFVCRKALALAPPGSEELPAIEAKLRALGATRESRVCVGDEYAAVLARELDDARPPWKLFHDDPKGGKTLDSYTSQSDVPGCLTSVAFWLAIVVAVFGLQWCGVLKPRSTRRPIDSLPPLNIRPNLNFGVPNINYNIPPPLNLRPYNEPLPRSTRQPRGRSTRPSRNDNAAPPPTSTERAPNRNAPPRE